METIINWIDIKEKTPTDTYEQTKYYKRWKRYLVRNEKGLVFVAEFMKESYNKTLHNYFRPVSRVRVLKNIRYWAEIPMYVFDQQITI